ncbi:hypothetical protein [uncultured Acinetobacter sp.]|uniref:hypothetical protein n=1 Tax=uncultured Acinetobacter sp. TaxID=165433 RepID=UPI0025D22135|nr:hypothetical protein [uncultured Acinetobacter sp.]
MILSNIRNRPEISGRIYMRHLRSVSMCAKGSRKVLIESFGLSDCEVADFFKNGMLIEDFKNKFGHDAMAQQAIHFFEREVENGWE